MLTYKYRQSISNVYIIIYHIFVLAIALLAGFFAVQKDRVMGTNVFLNRHTKEREVFTIDTEEVVHDIFQNLEALKDYLESNCDEQILIDQDYGSSYMNGIKHHMMLIDYLDCWNVDEPDVWKRYCGLLEKHLCNVHEKFIDQFLADVYFQKCEHLKLIELYKKQFEESDNC